jgi:hypothetical protein
MKLGLLCASLAWSTLLLAQTGKEEVLDNAEVVTLIKLGLSKEIVKAKIQSDKTNFNLSGDSLAGLKRAGVGDDVILAMMAKAKPAAPGSSPALGSSDSRPVDKAPALAPGWYIRNGAGFDRIEPSMLRTVPAKGAWGTLKKGLGVLVPLGIHAELQGDSAKTALPKTCIIIFVPDSFPTPTEPKTPTEFLLVRLDQSAGTRAINFQRPVVAPNAAIKDPNIKLKEGKTIVFASRRLPDGMYEIKCPLPPGQYCLMLARSSYYTGHAFPVIDFGAPKN